jgi:hypothetical protein
LTAEPSRAPADPFARWYELGGVLVLLAGLLFAAYFEPIDGEDYVSFHLMGRAWLEGVNVYDAAARAALCARVGDVDCPAGMYYPPVTGFLVMPYALLPFQVARHFWYWTLVLVAALGVRALVRHLSPASPGYVWRTVVGAVLMSATLRWGLILSQGAPIQLGLLCWFVVALEKRAAAPVVGLATLATAFKMTLSLPFLGLLALTRRFAFAAIAGGSWLLLNALGLLRMGGFAVLPIYGANTATLDALDDPTNINMPDPWREIALPRTDWTFLFFGVLRDLPLSRLLGLGCSGLISLWLLYEGLRTKAPHSPGALAMFLGPLIGLGSVCVYHHQYDLCLFLVPVLIVLFRYRTLAPPPLAVWLVLPLLAVILFMPIGTAQNLLGNAFGRTGVALVKFTFPIVTILGLFGTLVALRRYSGAEVASDAAGAPQHDLRPPVS